MNGFDDLERQLRQKVTTRAARGRRPLARALIIALGLLASGAVTAAATGVIGGPGTEQRAQSLLNEVTRATADVPVCRLRGGDRRPARLSALPASDAARRAFPLLLRAPTARERALARRYGRMAGMAQVLSDGARELRASDGTRFLLMITAGRGRGLGRDPGCFAVQRAALERRSRDVDPAVLAAARRLLARQEHSVRANLGREGLLLVQLRDNGQMSGGGGTYSDVAIRLGTGSIGTARVNGRPRIVVTGLVPASVDHVILRPRSGDGRPIRLQVREQVFHQVLPRGFGNRVAVQWRASDGRLLRVLQLRY